MFIPVKKGASEDAHIVFIDEAGLQLEPLRRRSYAPRGEQPVLRLRVGPRKKVSLIGAISISPRKQHHNLYFDTLPDGSFRSPNVAAFLRELLKHLRGRVIVIWDNGPMSSGVVEGFNLNAKLAMRKAYGFRTYEGAQIALYHQLGKLPEPELTHRFC